MYVPLGLRHMLSQAPIDPKKKNRILDVVDYLLDMLMEQCGKWSHPYIVLEPKWDSVWDILFGALPIFPPTRIQPTVAASLWLWLHAFIFILYLLWTLCVPVAHLFCSALRGILMTFLVDILTLELLFCKSTYCTFLECPQDLPRLSLCYQGNR